MKYITLLFFSILVFYSCNSINNRYYDYHPTGPSSNMKMPKEPGRCFDICLTPEILKIDTSTFPIYTGTDSKIIDHYTIDSIHRFGTLEWEWVDSPETALPGTMNNQTIQEIGSDSYIFKNYLTDTNVTNEYYIDTIFEEKLAVRKGREVWMPILCEDDEHIKRAVQIELQANGYDLGNEFESNKFGLLSEEAFQQYQIDNNLHLGLFTEETLDAMAIDY